MAWAINEFWFYKSNSNSINLIKEIFNRINLLIEDKIYTSTIKEDFLDKLVSGNFSL